MTASSTAKSGSEGAFLRKSSGVIRAMSPRDGMYFGYLSATGLYGVALYLFVGIATFPQANIWLSTVISFVLFGLVFWVYGVLGSAMPRSGGDYVFTSRILNPALGFTLAFGGWAFWQFFYSFFAANTVITGGLQPLFSDIGVATGSKGWINASTTVGSSGVRLTVTIILLLLAGFVMINGLKWYLRIQKYFMIPATLIAVVIIAAQFALVPHATFLRNFNIFERRTGGLSASQIVTTAQAQGFHLAGVNWGDTWGLSVLLAGAFLWCMWQTELLGELKTAKSFRNVVSTMWGASFLLMITFMVGIAWTFEYVGHKLMGSFAYLAINDPGKLGGGWAWRGAASLFGIPTLNVVLMVFIFLGFVGIIAQSMFNTTLTASRLYLSMAFDRTLPAQVGSVNRKGAPTVAVGISVGISIVLAIIYQFQPNLATAWYSATVASLIAMLGTAIAGALFPYRLPEAYRVSPAARFKILGIPAVTVVGAGASLFLLATILYYVLKPQYGLLTSGAVTSWIIMGLLFLVSPIYFYLIRAKRAHDGINLDYAFAEVPPE